MSTKKKGSPLPETGGFPGYTRGASIFNAWSNALCANADSWNTLWAKMRDGKDVGFKDWSKAVAGCVEANSTFVEQALYTAGGPTAPPWVALPFAAKSEAEVRVPAGVDVDLPPLDVPLCLLGSPQTVTAKVHVRALSAHTIGVSLDDTQAAALKGHKGQYIALVLTEEYAAPIAIVSVLVD